jgi:hypothetical protein
MVQNPRVRAARQSTIERGDMVKVNGMIVHQMTCGVEVDEWRSSRKRLRLAEHPQ